MPSPYSTPGNHTQGIWYVRKGSSAFLVDRANLPHGPGWQFYWLGTNANQIENRITNVPFFLVELGINIQSAAKQALTNGSAPMSQSTLSSLLSQGLDSPTSSVLAYGALKAAGPSALASAGSAAAKAAGAFAAWESFKNPAVWWRIAEGLIGLLLGYLALKQFMSAAQGSSAIAKPSVPKVIPL